jgi:hypothetical protein
LSCAGETSIASDQAGGKRRGGSNRFRNVFGVSWDVAKEEKDLLFLKKKKQKDFYSWCGFR